MVYKTSDTYQLAREVVIIVRVQMQFLSLASRLHGTTNKKLIIVLLVQLLVLCDLLAGDLMIAIESIYNFRADIINLIISLIFLTLRGKLLKRKYYCPLRAFLSIGIENFATQLTRTWHARGRLIYCTSNAFNVL